MLQESGRIRAVSYTHLDVYKRQIVKSEPKVHDNSIYEAVHAEEPYVDQCLRRYLGRIAKCETEEELRASGNGVTADCYSYNNYIFRHLKKNDYEKYACIGTKVSKAKLREKMCIRDRKKEDTE